MALKGAPTRTKGNENDGPLARSRTVHKYHSQGQAGANSRAVFYAVTVDPT
jgi:hypothetical protein